MPLIVNERFSIPAHELEVSFARSGGAGGQNVNKVSSKALVRWHFAASQAFPWELKARLWEKLAGKLTDEGDLLVVSDKTRDQHQNIDDARAKLAAMVRAALLVPKPRRATKPTKGSKRRRLEDKSRRGEVKQGRGRVRDED
ncbi:MAG: aminoacyl-tRNA hydrolase [Deltaproteobacteria bacterium]|nr:aminoacyl-tRNA hydrolase [Deltaproteobacteria bacterium]